jgi:hypothetical protein
MVMVVLGWGVVVKTTFEWKVGGEGGVGGYNQILITSSTINTDYLQWWKNKKKKKHTWVKFFFLIMTMIVITT